jgi:endonuclease-3 related protein
MLGASEVLSMADSSSADSQFRPYTIPAPKRFMHPTLKEVLDRLYATYGPRHWWPGESPFEILIGAVLVQNTSWQNVETAIDRLRRDDLLEPYALYSVPLEELEELIRPAGHFRVKARRLRSLLEFLVERYDGSLKAMFQTGQAELREALLQVKGIGPETADSILLYAGGLPAFVVDAYTHRVLARHGWIGFDADYYEIQDHFFSGLPQDAALYNEYHALLVEVGKRHCRKQPRCGGCPLAAMLPSGGPLEPD